MRDMDLAVMNALNHLGCASTREVLDYIEEEFGITSYNVRKRLTALEKYGMVTKLGVMQDEGRTGHDCGRWRLSV